MEIPKNNHPRDANAPQQLVTEESAKRDSDIFALLVDAVEDYAIFALDTRGNILTWNTGARRLKGYSSTEIIGKNFSIFYSEEDRRRHHPQFELDQATKVGKYEEEGWRFRKDGSRFWANVVITALRDSRGVLRGFGKVTRDLTARRDAETRLRESEERFRLMVEGVADYAIFMLDPGGHVSTWNKGAERNTGYSASDIIGRHFSDFYPESDKAAGKPEMELHEAVRLGRFEDEGWRVRKDGTTFWANVIITPIFDQHKKLLGFAKVTRDLTERKRSEDKAKNAHAELEAMVESRTRELLEAKLRAENAVQARDQFFSIASHELKTPLTSLKLQAQMRRRNLARGALKDLTAQQIEKMFESDEKQVSRLSVLIDNMLDVSRLSSGNFELSLAPADLVEIVDDIHHQLEPLLKQAGNTVEIRRPEKLPGIWDRHRLEQVLINLLSNASKYAPHSRVEIVIEQKGDWASLSVHDYGRGIPASEHDRIFHPFERLQNQHGASGLGLGLFIVKQIVEAHHGTISLDSAPGQGTRFTVTLPLDSSRA